MKIFGLKTKSLLKKECFSGQQIVSKKEFDALEKANLFLKEVRAQGANYLKTVRKKRYHYAQTVRERFKKWRCDQEKLVEAALAESRQKAAAQAVDWYGNMQEFEEQLYPQLLNRAMRWVTEKIEEKIGDLNISGALTKAVEEYLSGEPPTIIGTLSVNVENYTEMQHWGDVFKNLKIEKNESLDLGQANLTTEFFTVHLSIVDDIYTMLDQMQAFMEASLKQRAINRSSQETLSKTNMSFKKNANQKVLSLKKTDPKQCKKFRHHSKMIASA